MPIHTKEELGYQLLERVQDAAELQSKEIVAALIGVLVFEVSDRFGLSEAESLLKSAADMLAHSEAVAH